MPILGPQGGDAGSNMPLPRMFRARQRFDHPRVSDVPARVRAELGTLRLDERIRAGETVAITAGSRGIAEYGTILAAIASEIRRCGGAPFVVPAMGSHGGGTGAGQRAMLETGGITEEAVGAPIRSSIETVRVGTTREGVPVHVDRAAYEADHVVVCNRVKPHTHFAGGLQSGLTKMLCIGLGNFEGARHAHRAFRRHGFEPTLVDLSEVIRQRCAVLGGLAIVENGNGDVGLLEGVVADRFEERERALLARAAAWRPRLPFHELDLLIVDEMGKDVSGAGLDPGVVGAASRETPGARARRLLRTVAGMGRAYRELVLRGARREDEREISQRDFLRAVSRMAGAAATRALRKAAGPRRAPANRPSPSPAAPGVRIGRLFVRDLTPESMGNVVGLQRADATTTRLAERADWRATLVNRLATGSAVVPALPPCFASDRDALEALLAGSVPGELRVARIRNTRHLVELELSATLLGPRWEERDDVEALESPARGRLRRRGQPRFEARSGSHARGAAGRNARRHPAQPDPPGRAALRHSGQRRPDPPARTPARRSGSPSPRRRARVRG